MASDMDLPPQESNGNTQPYDDNRNVRTLSERYRLLRDSGLEFGVVTSQKHMSGEKYLQPSCEDRVLVPRDDEQMATLQRTNIEDIPEGNISIALNPSTQPSEANHQYSMVGIRIRRKPSHVQLVEDMDVDPETFEDTHQEKTTTKPSSKFQSHVLPGTQQSLLDLLGVCSRELAIGCHGILTTVNNQPTEHGEYEEGVWSDKGHQFVKGVGSGSYGCVKLYRDNTTNVEFVKKQILNKDADFLDEVKFLSELNHGNIVQLYGFILRDNIPEILMEYAGVSLEEYTIRQSCQDDVSEDKIIEMTYQGLSGLEYLDSKGIIHYDIKPQNLCVHKKGSNITLKITDFGSAKRVTESPNFTGFTLMYLSPELAIQLIKYQSGIQNLPNVNTADYVMTTKSDIFSFALSIMFVYRKEDVFISFFNNRKMSYNEQAILDLAKNPSLVENQLIPDACCSDMCSILRDMVEEVPHKRPTARKIKANMDVLLNRIPSNSSLTADIQDQGSLPYGYTGHEKMDTSD